MISNLFRTRYKIELRDDGYLWTGYKKWHSLKWQKLGWSKTMDDAMEYIANHKNSLVHYE